MPNNMGMVRYFLALSVVISHFNILTGADIPWFCGSYTGVCGFFAVSGFLVYGGYLRRRNIKQYIQSRARRILPAYLFTIVFFAIAFCFVSTLPVTEYFKSSQLYKYLIANICFANFVEPTLPGVFDNYAIPAVNGSLWTMKVEWFLYLSVPISVWIASRLKMRPLSSFLWIYILSVFYKIGFDYAYSATGKEIFQILSRQFFGQLMFFYSGVLIYHYFSTFMKYKWYIIIFNALCLIFLRENTVYYYVLEPFVISSTVLWFSMVGKWGTWEGRKDNVSYNIYLVHFPIIQLAVFMGLPETIGVPLCFAITLAACFALSFIMLYTVERHFWRRKQLG